MRAKAALLLVFGVLVSTSWAQSTNQFAQPSAASEFSNPSTSSTGSASSDDDIPTIRKSVQEVNVIFTVTDKKGHFKKDLKENDLSVLDDGRPPAAVRSFRSETDLPMRVGLVLDVSGSITDRFTFEQDSAIRFFSHVLRPQTDKAFVLAFDSTPTLTQDFTDNADLLSAGVKKLSPGGGSAVYDAIYEAASEKFTKLDSDRPMRRVIILISDGEDNQSRIKAAGAIDAAKRAEVTIYAISTNTANVVSRGDKLLKKLAEETGGRAFFPNKVEDVVKAFENIQDELRSQYALSYKPAEFVADGRYRTISIQARNDRNLIVRSRKGYFAPAQ